MPEPIWWLEFASIKQEKGVQIFYLSDDAAHYESEAVLDRLDEILNIRSKKIFTEMGVERELLGEHNV